jgi:hypothetical protein
MKTTLNTQEITNALLNDNHAAWSYNGARALAEYLEEYEEACGVELELDVVALRCTYSEHDGFIDWADEHFANYMEDFGIEYINPMTGESDNQSVVDCDGNFHETVLNNIEAYICDNGHLIEFEGGIIVSKF